MMGLANLQKKSVVEEIIDQIINGILTNKFLPGEKIPTEQELANAMGVSRNSVREAVKTLISYGILEIKRPEGTYVCKGFVPAMINPSLYGLIIGSSSSRDIIMLRKMVDIGIIHCAIDVASEDDIYQIKKSLDKLIYELKKDEIDIDAVVRCDVDFHSSINEATHNVLTHIINNMITQITLFSRKNTIENTIVSGNVEKMISIHVGLYEVIKNRNRSDVAEVVEQSYEIWRTVI
ncbi:MAG: FadR/GntR family transcriptional regulator [Filifactoraceae bacterium]